MRFILFFTTFSSLYGLLHFYAFMKARAAFSFGRGAGLLLGLFMVLMVFCPVFVRVLERSGLESIARLTAYWGYAWMGFLFIFVSASFVLDVTGLMAGLAGGLLKENSFRLFFSSRTAFYLALVLSIGVTVYGSLEALGIQSEHITIRSSKMTPTPGRLRIVQISDIHLGLIVREGRLEKILRRVKEARPDILVSTGDLVDGQINDLTKMAGMFRDVPAMYGKFAVTGNHEFYAGLDRSVSFTEAAGFSVLRGEGITVADAIHIAGVDDPAGDRFGRTRKVSESLVLSGFSEGRFTLLLKHRPVLDPESSGLFDLQLSGHTHKGQIFPFTLLIKMLYPVDSGLLRLENGAFLYVSRGSGTWGPPMRFLSPPEVTVIDLISEDAP